MNKETERKSFERNLISILFINLEQKRLNMPKLIEIREPVKVEMEAFEKFFSASIRSKIPLLDILTKYILKRKGKQIRPLLVFLTAKMLGGVSASTYTAASLIELLHTATLVHDDVVDESYERRGLFSINAIWRSKVAVLFGDYLLAKGLLLTVEKGDYELLSIVSDAVKQMSEGELVQFQKSYSLNLDIDTYYEVIRKKTATLIASCTACGAKSAGAGDKAVNEMYELGTAIGMAFQIKDDLFDYQPGGLTGKPAGNDIKEKKFTLPLLYTLKQASFTDRRKIIHLIKDKQAGNSKVKKIFSYVEKYKGLEYAEEKMLSFRDSAIEILHRYPESPARQSLLDLIDYTVLRTK